MKGLTYKAKEEIAALESDECCLLALLSALIHSAGSISFTHDGMGVYLISENEATLKLASRIVSSLYHEDVSHVQSGIEMRGSFVPAMLFDLGILTHDGEKMGAYAGISGFVVAKDCCVKSYLRGLFLGCGSVSVAKKYHLEMSFSTPMMAEDVIAIVNGFGIDAHYILRKDKHIVYLKSSESISDFLALIGANKAVLDLNNTAAMRFVNMYTNRRINCDMANADKVVETSLKQNEAISKIINIIDDPRLKATGEARLNNPDASYGELAEILGVSKGCIKYRLHKLMEWAKKNQTKD